MPYGTVKRVMATRNHNFAPGEFYHLYNRGTDKRIIFQSASDYTRFVELLYLANATTRINVRDIIRDYGSVWEYPQEHPLVAIGAYCLMLNHFHILLTPLVEGGIGMFMNKLCTSYSMYFNKKYERTGSLFQGPYKSRHATTNQYLKYLYAYIHLNPLELCQRPGEDSIEALLRYPHSSLPDYTRRIRPELAILNPSLFPDYFHTSAEHLADLQSWLAAEADRLEL